VKENNTLRMGNGESLQRGSVRDWLCVMCGEETSIPHRRIDEAFRHGICFGECDILYGEMSLNQQTPGGDDAIR
jgi:hypothetical protein